VTELDEVKRILKGIDDLAERQLRFAAILARELEVSSKDFIIVGGSATAIYTDGRYASGDIDAVLTARREERTRVLRRWGFTQQGRQWYNEDLGVYLDFVKPPYTGDISRTQVIATPEGQVRVAAVEDVLVKWLMSAKWWREPKDVDHARLLAAANRDRIDWAYVQRLSEEGEVADFLAALRKSLGLSPSKLVEGVIRRRAPRPVPRKRQKRARRKRSQG
jgi:hypothetical protein